MYRTQIGAALLTGLVAATVSACGSDDEIKFAGEGGNGGVANDPQFDPAPGGIRRLLSHQYTRTLSYLLGPDAAAVADPPTDFAVDGFDAIGAATVAMPLPAPETYESNATAVAEAVLANPTVLAGHVPCVTSSPNAACFTDVAETFGMLAWRRPLTGEETTTLVNIANQGQAWGGTFESGLKYELMAILQSPNFLYIVEIGEEQEGTEDRALTSYELAARMGFFLNGLTPDAELLAAAANGDLDTDEGIRAEARRLLKKEEAKEMLDIFYDELLFLRDLPTLAKDDTEYPQFDAALTDAMRIETLLLIRDVVWEKNGDARELFNADYTFVNADLAQLYGVDAPTDGGWARRDLPANQDRAGILAQPSIMARFAHPAKTSPTRRGLFFKKKLLCEDVPPPPGDVDTTLPEDIPNQPMTTKQKLEQIHFQVGDQCKSCHELFDPYGFGFEHFDAIGQYRSTENGIVVDSAGEVLGFGTFASPAEMAAIFTEDERMGRCIVRNFIRSGLGHLDTEGERPAVTALREGFEENYNMQDLMVEMTISPAFRLVADPK